MSDGFADRVNALNIASIGAAGQLRAAKAAAAGNVQAANLASLAERTPSLQPASFASESFLPWQEQLGQKLGTTYSGLLDALTARLGQTPTGSTPTGGGIPTGGGGLPTGGGLPGGGDFSNYFGNVTGAMPAGRFTDIPIEDVITPTGLQGQVNRLFASAHTDAGARAQGLLGGPGLFDARPGMAPVLSKVGHDATMLNLGTRAAAQNAFMDKIVPYMFENQQQKLQARGMQTNVENSRLNAALQQAAVASGLRGQDIQNQLGQGRLAVDRELGLGRLGVDRELGLGRLDVDREGNLFRAIGGVGGGGGGFLTPLKTSFSGPAGYIFPSSSYQPIKPVQPQASGGRSFSDRRLKSNIKRIGTLPNGLAWYEYDIFGNRTQGVMAQEVFHVIPDAVIVDSDGFYMVDYSMIL